LSFKAVCTDNYIKNNEDKVKTVLNMNQTSDKRNYIVVITFEIKH